MSRDLEKMDALRALIAIVVMVAFYPAHAALLPPSMIDAVVALGAMVNTAPPGQPPKIEWATLGTGFFYGYKVKDDPDVTKREYEVYLVTAGHVVSEFRESRQGDLFVRINSKGPTSPSKTFNIPFNPRGVSPRNAGATPITGFGRLLRGH